MCTTKLAHLLVPIKKNEESARYANEDFFFKSPLFPFQQNNIGFFKKRKDYDFNVTLKVNYFLKKKTSLILILLIILFMFSDEIIKAANFFHNVHFVIKILV